jgi:hypothetical protein
MTLSRRGLFGVFASALAAPAIVRVESLMRLAPTEIIRAPSISMRMIEDYAVGDDQLVSRLDVLYNYLHIRPEWKYIPQEIPAALTLDDYAARVMGPSIDKFVAQQQKIFEDAVMDGSSAGGLAGLLGATSPLE